MPTLFRALVLALFALALTPCANATIYYDQPVSSPSCGASIYNSSVDGKLWESWGDQPGTPNGSMGRSTIMCDDPPSGSSKYARWSPTACANNTAISVDFTNVPVVAGRTYYLAFKVRFNRIGGQDVWIDTGPSPYSFDKLAEFVGSGFRWGVGSGWDGWLTTGVDHKFAFDIWYASTVITGLDQGAYPDHKAPNVSPYNPNNPLLSDYEQWHSVVLGVTASESASTGLVHLWVNGAKTHQIYQKTMMSGASFGRFIAHGTVAQGSGTFCVTNYAAPPHYRDMTAMLITDSWADLTARGYLSGDGGGTVVAPSNTAAPSISGSPVQGQTLTATTGTWSGSAATYAYQWQRGTTNISGATARTYTAGAGDVGSTLRVVVTATNQAGAVSANSANTATVTAPAPVVAPSNIAVPTVSGSPLQGQTLTATTGTWSGSAATYAYQWQRGTTNIGGATARTYAVGSGDVGSTLRVVVTATNSAGSASANSANTATVSVIAPANTAAPTISGSPVQGQVLTATTGTWSGSAATYAYQWQRGTTNISGATARTYTAGAGDVGSTLRVVVTATNQAGAVSANSANTATVTAPAATTYTVTPTVGANGTVSPGTAQTVIPGATAQFTVTPNSGYQAAITTGTCGGSPTSGTAPFTYTTGAIAGNCSFSVAFTSASTDSTPPEISGLQPTTTAYPVTTRYVTLRASTNEPARCRAGASGTAWAWMTPYSTALGASHAKTYAVTAGRAYRVCTRCQDAAGNISGESCTNFSVAPGVRPCN